MISDTQWYREEFYVFLRGRYVWLFFPNVLRWFEYSIHFSNRTPVSAEYYVFVGGIHDSRKSSLYYLLV